MVEVNHLTDKKDTKFQPGWKGGPGRPKKLKTQVKDFIKEYPQAVEQLMVTLYELGIKGDIEAAKYVIDRIKGKPKATIGIDEQDKELVSIATVLAFRKMIDNREGYIEGQIVTEGASQVEEAETA
tara:strand:- start:235 stop:612 length:378 start_codon:yes stop_codon:yes gene_type:complete